MSIQFGSDARQEIREALLYSSTNFGLGKGLRDEIRRFVNLIMQDSGWFRARASGVRILKLERFPYSVISLTAKGIPQSMSSPSPTPPAAPAIGNPASEPLP